jgi:hypothetical protein
MSRYVCATVLFVALLAFMGTGPVPAIAGDWLTPVDGAVVLAYGSPWVDAGGQTCTHGGIDLGASAGGVVRACSAGDVVFAGLVPAGEGARAYAVTVLTSDGLRVTYLPLRSVRVSRGQALSAGSTVGLLAGSGDGSWSEPHLHLGVKRGGAALDPAAFLAPAVPAAPPAAPEPVKSSVRSPARAPGVASASPAWSSARVSTTPNVAAAEALAARGAAETLAETPMAVRVESVAEPAVLDLDRAGADMASERDAASSVALRLGLFLVAAGCVAPVFRRARSALGRTAAVPVTHDRG